MRIDGLFGRGRGRGTRFAVAAAMLTLFLAPTAGADDVTPMWWEYWSYPAPPTADFFSVVYDESSRQSLMFGGVGYASPTSKNTSSFNGLYAWDGAAWTKLCTASPCSARVPSPRWAHAMAYDTVRKVAIVYGGWRQTVNAPNPSDVFTDTWLWDGTAWTQACASGACGTSAPDPIFAAMAFDSARGKAVLFGGFNCSSLSDCGGTSHSSGATWEWNGKTWDSVCTAPCVNPPARLLTAMAYDSARARTVLFGGFEGGASLGDTWEWDGTTWKQACQRPPCSDSAPPARAEHGLAYDSARKRTVMFGGCADLASGCSNLSDTWDWDGGTWKKTAETPGLAPNGELAMAFDSARRRVVLVSGFGSTEVDNSEAWEFYVRNNACTSDGDCDTGHCVDDVCCATACNVCNACNLPGTVGTCATIAGCTGVCDGSLLSTPDGNRFDCTPYLCANGSCATTCNTAADCLPPNVCDAARNCIPPPANPPLPSGCQAGTERNPGLAALGAALAAVATGLCRRRRSSPRAR